MVQPFYMDENVSLLHGDSLEVLKEFPDNSIDSIVTDPPYGLSFMGKKWDYDVPGEDIWRECLRVLKPGGHLLAFAGTRTQHRMAVRIEDAGFEIRDMIAWVYGSGFPKSHNVGNAVDKSLGCENRGHAISSGSQIHPTTGKPRANGELLPKYEGRTDEGKKWAGFGTALKPAMEPITVARKPFKGTVAANVLEHGTGAINVDGCRVHAGDVATERTRHGGGIAGNGTSYEMPDSKGKQPPGRWPANLIHDGSDEVVGLFPVTTSGVFKQRKSGSQFLAYARGAEVEGCQGGDSGSAARFFYCAKANKRDRDEGCDALPLHETRYGKNMSSSDKGTISNSVNPSRNNHPTVKPTDLMRYLCRLVTPPGGTVLDPFMGSGSTGKAAVREGFRFIGIDMDEESCEISVARINFQQQKCKEKSKILEYR